MKLFDAVQSELIRYVVSHSDTQQQAAQRLGLGERTLRVWLRRMGYGPRQQPEREPVSTVMRRVLQTMGAAHE